ncbi:MAG: bluetail domain-containing putative surface protein [Prochlorococcaceae cyanobacterium]
MIPLTPLGLAMLSAALLVILFVPRRWARMPILLAACFVILAQGVMLGSLNFFTPQPAPSSGNRIPLFWNDPIFVSMAERTSTYVVPPGGTASNVSINSFDREGSTVVADGGATIERFRVRAREGFRGGSGEQYLNQMYIEINGTDTHADALQMYRPGSTGRVTLTNSYFRLNPPSTNPYVHLGNAAYWSANDWRGAHVFQNVLLAGGSYSLKIPGDGGTSISLKDVYFLRNSSAYGPFWFPEVNGVRPAIVRWENVRYASLENGQLVIGDLIPQPYGVTRDYTDSITGTDGQDTFALTASRNTYVGKNGNDIFRLTNLNQSLISNYDFITDFSIGLDVIDAPNTQPITPTIISSQPTALTSAAIGTLLNSNGNFNANGAAVFTYGGSSGRQVFLALNNGAGGYSPTEDAIIEITGYSGNLSQLQVF